MKTYRTSVRSKIYSRVVAPKVSLYANESFVKLTSLPSVTLNDDDVGVDDAPIMMIEFSIDVFVIFTLDRKMSFLAIKFILDENFIKCCHHQ
jgi:hypothetical protein